MKAWWVIETHPFSMTAHRMLVFVEEHDLEKTRSSNPELNVRLATLEDIQDPYIERVEDQFSSAIDRYKEQIYDFNKEGVQRLWGNIF